MIEKAIEIYERGAQLDNSGVVSYPKGSVLLRPNSSSLRYCKLCNRRSHKLVTVNGKVEGRCALHVL